MKQRSRSPWHGAFQRTCHFILCLGFAVSLIMMFVAHAVSGASLERSDPNHPVIVYRDPALFPYGMEHPALEDMLCWCTLFVWLPAVLFLIAWAWRSVRRQNGHGRHLYSNVRRALAAVIILVFAFLVWLLALASWASNFLYVVVVSYNVVPYLMGWLATGGIPSEILTLIARQNEEAMPLS